MRRYCAGQKGVEAQRAQSAIMNSLTDTRGVDKLKIMTETQKYSQRRPSTHIKMPAKQMCSHCGSSHPLRQCPAYEKKCTDCGKIGHFRGECRSKRTRAVNEVEHEAAQGSIQESTIDLVNKNSNNFSKNHLVITANLQTLGNKCYVWQWCLYLILIFI